MINIVPEVGLREDWTHDTDILPSWNGVEQRIALQSRPRVRQRMTFNVVTQAQRRAFWELFGDSLDIPIDIPMFAWGTKVTAAALTGASQVFFNTSLASIADGDKVILLNPDTGVSQSLTVNVTSADNVTTVETLNQDVTTAWVAFKGMTALIQNGPTIGWQTVTGEVSITADSWVDPIVQRTGGTATLNTLNSLPILERKFLEGSDERPEFVRDVIDFGGAREIGTRFYGTRFNGRKVFRVKRWDPDDSDYWRLFIDTANGAQKAFLLGTQLDDMTLSTALVAAGTTMVINELDAYQEYHVNEAFQYFQITYTDGTTSEHQILSSVSNGTVTFTPALPNDPKVANVEKISYLLKTRMSDAVRWQHDSVDSFLTFSTTTTNDG